MEVAATNKDENVFIWTDEEISLLLEAVRSNKSKCEYEGLNWESVRPKYGHIKSIFIERYTSNVDEENNGNKEQFPRTGIAEIIGKERIGAKVKKIQICRWQQLTKMKMSSFGLMKKFLYYLKLCDLTNRSVNMKV